MRIEQQYYNILWHKQPKDILLAIEQAGRTCYKSEDRYFELLEDGLTPLFHDIVDLNL